MIELTERAVDKVKEFAAATPEVDGKRLRIFIQGVGCSGFAYGFTFDDEREGDTVVAAGDLAVLVDAGSAPHLSGASVDFVDDERGTGFLVANPNTPEGSCSSGGCSGCG